MATDDITPDESFDEGFDAVDDIPADTPTDLPGDDLDDDLPGQPGIVTHGERLRVVLFTLGAKLKQRRKLGLKAFVMLMTMLLLTVAMAVLTPFAMMLLGRTEPFSHLTSYWVNALYVVLALSPFVISVVNYFWTTYAQIFFRGLTNFEAMLRSEPFEEFAPYVDVELLTDDWSVFSLLQNVFAVDVGFSMLRFFIVLALLVFPLAIQAGVSLAVILMVKGKGEVIEIVLAGGLTIIYFVFFVFTLIKNASFYSSLTKERG